MSNLLQVILISFAGTALLPFRGALAQQLEPIDVLPKLGADWEVSVEDHKSKVEPASPFRWAVFQNGRTGDFLSFATHPGFGKNRSLEYLTDTSLESFPNGRPVWTQSIRNITTHVIATKVVNVGQTNASLKGEEVLEYCFISESSGRGNLMAHGRTWVGPKGIVFAQHTSAKPIASDLVDRTIESIIEDQATLARPATR